MIGDWPIVVERDEPEEAAMDRNIVAASDVGGERPTSPERGGGQVRVGIGAIERDLASLDKVVAQLAERLNPYLRTRPVQDEDRGRQVSPDRDPIYEPVCPMAAQVCDVDLRLQGLQRSMTRLVEDFEG